MVRLKRAVAVVLATAVWTFRDSWESIREGLLSIASGLGHLLVLALIPVVLVQNFIKAWELRHVVNEKTRWLP